MLTLIIGLFILGLALVFLEVLFLEGVLGVIGALAFVGAWTLVFVEYGMHWGLFSILGSAVAVIGMVVTEVKIVSRTKFGRRILHETSIDSTSQAPLATEELVGREGETLTTMTPTGVIVVDGRRFEGFSMSGRLERGTRVRVEGYDNFRVKVRAIQPD